MSATPTEVARRVVLQWWSKDSFVVFEAEAWEYLRQMTDAVFKSKSWGELRRRMPGDEFESLINWDDGYMYVEGSQLIVGDPAYLTDAEDSGMVFRPDTPFTAYDILSVPDGDYPPWVGQILDSRRLPAGVVGAYAERADSFLNGSWLQFNWEQRDEVVRALEREGVEVVSIQESR